MHTEDDAKIKWCPYALTGDSVNSMGQSVNRYWRLSENRSKGSAHPECRCIASECMAWRWLPPTWRDENGTLWNTHDPQNSKAKMERIDHGYCGLAGKP